MPLPTSPLLAQQTPAPAAPAASPAAPAPAPAAPAATPAAAPAGEAVSAQTTQPAPGTPAAPAPQPPSMFNPMMLIFMVGMVLLMILMGGPERKRRKALAARIAAMKSGDGVVTAGGIHGVIAQVKDTTVFLRLADNQRIEVDKTAITQVKGKPDGTVSKSSDRDAKTTSAEVVEEKP